MEFLKTKIEGLYVIKPKVFQDKRGYFCETFRLDELHKNTNFKGKFCQENESQSCFGVLRGLHFQKDSHSQTKLVRVLSGEILDVVVDIRPESKTFGTVFKIKLSSENKNQLLIPKGFAHGFSTLSKKAVINYKVDSYYNPNSESGIIYNDPELNIDWELKKSEMTVSDKDIRLKTFRDIKKSLNIM